MGSPIQEFYRDKNIFITGATGFLGKVLVEKLLYSCPDINHLYLLIRTKKDKNPQQRILEYFEDKVFSRLDQKSLRLKVSAISGDVTKPGLGLNEKDRKLLKERINIIYHGAATTRFYEQLTIAIDINIFGTKEIIQLAKEMDNLVAFVHISTAYSNPYVKHIKERFYDATVEKISKETSYFDPGNQSYIATVKQLINPNLEEISESRPEYENLITLNNSLKSDGMKEIAPMILGEWPNTYIFTKSNAENLIKIQSRGIPICILRPGAIVSSYKEPLPGWLDEVIGSSAIVVLCLAGVLRVVHCDENCVLNFVPVDFTINAIISAAWKLAKQFQKPSEGTNGKILRTDENPVVYNFVGSAENPLYYSDVNNLLIKYGNKYPTTKVVWYPSLDTERSRFLFKIKELFLHILPALILDMISFLFGKRTNFLKNYNKRSAIIDLSMYFLTRNWKFETDNVEMLWQSLSKEDKKLFPFDFSSLDWDDYFHNYVRGIRQYTFKDDTSTLRYAQKRLHRLKIMHYFFKWLIIFLMFIFIVKIIIF